MKTLQYVKDLKRANGLPKAIQIAEKCVYGSSVENRANLPHSEIYFKKDKKGNTTASEREALRIHNFWKEVLSLLRKES